MTCNGTGRVWNTRDGKLPAKGGTGLINSDCPGCEKCTTQPAKKTYYIGPFPVPFDPCLDCDGLGVNILSDGTGLLVTEDCPTCHGTGRKGEVR